jgi:hypothetical protein
MDDRRGDTPWTKLGFQEQGSIKGLVLQRFCSSLLVTVDAQLDAGLRGDRIYYRRYDEQTYHSVPVIANTETQADVKSCTTASVIVFASSVYERARQGKGWVAQGSDLWKFDLLTGQRDRMIQSTSIVTDPPHERAFIRGLLSISSDASSATVTLGLQRSTESGRTIEHGIYDVGFATGRIAKVATLPYTFA